MDERQRRIGSNEAVFREVNERIEQLAAEFDLRGRPLELVCECGNASCASHIAVPVEDYERIRSEGTLFAVYPGHELPDVEAVVEKCEGYYVVRKDAGEAAELAETTNPRT